MRGAGWLIALCCAVVTGVPGESRGDEIGGSAMRAYVDPQTGQLVPAPAVPVGPQALPAPAPALVEQPGPRSGVMVDLKGQFMTDAVATVNPDGSVHLDCVPGGTSPTDPAR